MGIAILWIMVTHSDLSFSFLPAFSSVAQFLKSNGFGGVDIFLLLSGFGTFLSLTKNADTVSFYKRRLQRVLPAYLPVLAAWLVFQSCCGLTNMLPKIAWNNLTGFAFWLQRWPAFNWYILALPVFYLLAPAFFAILKRWGRGGELGLLALTLALDVCFLNTYIMIAISRFTVFALGMIAGKWYSEERDLSPMAETWLYILGGMSWLLLYEVENAVPNLLWNYGLYWYPFIFIAPASVCLLCRLFDLLERAAVGRRLNLALAGIGACSLEIYLLHAEVFERLDIASNWAWSALIVLTIALGKLYHELLAAVMGRKPEPCEKTARRKEKKEEEKREQKTLPTARSGKKVYIEFMRIVACFLVIVNHTEEQLWTTRGASAVWAVGLVYFFICKIAVPLFLMIMGAVVLDRIDPPEKTAKRLLRGAGVLLVVSALYYVYYATVNGEPMRVSDFLMKVIQTQTSNALWYMYLYLGLLCLLPLLQKMVGALDQKDLRWLLFLSVGVLGALPFIRLFVPAFGLSGYFTAVLFSTYIGVVVFGYYIERYVVIDRRKAVLAGALFVGLIVLQTVITYWFYQKDPGTYMYLDDRNMITITGATVCFYIVVKYLFSQWHIGERAAKAINTLGSLTFGIYLLSDLAISLTRPLHQRLCQWLPVVPAILLWELLIFAACAVITAGLRRLPGLRKWL